MNRRPWFECWACSTISGRRCPKHAVELARADQEEWNRLIAKAKRVDEAEARAARMESGLLFVQLQLRDLLDRIQELRAAPR